MQLTGRNSQAGEMGAGAQAQTGQPYLLQLNLHNNKTRGCSTLHPHSQIAGTVYTWENTSCKRSAHDIGGGGGVISHCELPIVHCSMHLFARHFKHPMQ